MRLPVQVECIVFRQNNDFEFLLLKRVESRGGFWQPVTGGLEKGERVVDAVYRELFEETGIKKNKVVKLLKNVHVFNFSSDGMKKEFGFEKIKEHVFGIGVGKDQEVRIDNKEHSKYAWFGFDKALSMLKWDNNKEGLKKLGALLAEDQFMNDCC